MCVDEDAGALRTRAQRRQRAGAGRHAGHCRTRRTASWTRSWARRRPSRATCGGSRRFTAWSRRSSGSSEDRGDRLPTRDRADSRGAGGGRRRRARRAARATASPSNAARSASTAFSTLARPGSACTPPPAARRRGLGHRSHPAQARCDRRRHRHAVPRGRGVEVRDRLRESHLGGARRHPAARHRRRRLLGGRVPAGCHDAGREAVRGAAGDLRRRHRDRHGPERRRPQVRRGAAGRPTTSGRGRRRAANAV